MTLHHNGHLLSHWSLQRPGGTSIAIIICPVVVWDADCLPQFEFLRKLSSDSTNTVIGLARNKDSTDKKVASELNQLKNVHILQADLTDYDALKASRRPRSRDPGTHLLTWPQQASVDDVAKITGGSIDVIIVNAGISPVSSAYDPIGTM